MYLIGDPHLGREFRAHVPLDRLGDREAMMMEDFETRLNASDETTVIVGDLFDRPVVSTQTLYTTLFVILSAAMARPTRKIIIMAGNHDLNKATEVRGSFHILAVALERVPNVSVLLEPEVIDGVAYFPWQYEVDAETQVDALMGQILSGKPKQAVGHWDLEAFDKDHTEHLCPAKSLIAFGITDIYSGHWHIAGEYKVDGTLVNCTGSMQPMTHAEDPKEKMYVTLSKQSYEERDPKDFANYYVRVRVPKGEEVTPPPTCLGFKTEPVDDANDDGRERVNLGNFDMNDILSQAFTSMNVKKDVQSFIKGNLNGVA
jgi:DNA repair exonuclease SbcCD nuclease subunit